MIGLFDELLARSDGFDPVKHRSGTVRLAGPILPEQNQQAPVQRIAPEIKAEPAHFPFQFPKLGDIPLLQLQPLGVPSCVGQLLRSRCRP